MSFPVVKSDNGDTITITTPNREGGPAFDFTIKKTFLKVFNLVKHLEETKDSKDVAVLTSCYEHMYQNKMENYQHNEHGPAVQSYLAPEFKQYYLNGKELNEEEIKKLIHNKEFGDKFNKFLEGDKNEQA